MEDVIVQRTTVRSTTQNPTPKKNATVFIQGDNINIGTLIVNSPNSFVDNSVNTVNVHQNFQSGSSEHKSSYRSAPTKEGQVGLFGIKSTQPVPYQEPTNIDRDFFKRAKPHMFTIIPNLLLMR
jgi:hypothetical protein